MGGSQDVTVYVPACRIYTITQMVKKADLDIPYQV